MDVETAPCLGEMSDPPRGEDEWRSQADALFGLQLPALTGATTRRPTAVDVLANAIRSVPGVTVVELAPMTNLAELARDHPGLGSRVREIVAMAGALDVPGNVVNMTSPEYNLYIDAQAADVVLRWRGVHKIIVPLDACDEVPVTPMFLDSIAASSRARAAQVDSKLLGSPYYYSGSQYFWDPAAAIVATDPAVAAPATERLAVVQEAGPDHGRLVRSATGAATSIVMHLNGPAFFDQLLSAFFTSASSSSTSGTHPSPFCAAGPPRSRACALSRPAMGEPGARDGDRLYVGARIAQQVCQGDDVVPAHVGVDDNRLSSRRGRGRRVGSRSAPTCQDQARGDGPREGTRPSRMARRSSTTHE
jgi:inosine-uridine nucleoside N-ribohydrolase